MLVWDRPFFIGIFFITIYSKESKYDLLIILDFYKEASLNLSWFLRK